MSLETPSENRDVECALLFASCWNAPGGASKWPKTAPKGVQRTPRPPKHTPKNLFIILIIILSTIVITIIIIVVIIILIMMIM